MFCDGRKGRSEEEEEVEEVGVREMEGEEEVGRFWIEATDSRRERVARDWKGLREIFGDSDADEEGEEPVEPEAESEEAEDEDGVEVVAKVRCVRGRARVRA